MRKEIVLVFLVLSCFKSFASNRIPINKSKSFIHGEKLYYSIYAGFIKIGEASLETRKKNGNWLIKNRIDTNYILSLIYPLHNVNYSYIYDKTLASFNYIMNINVKKKKFKVNVKINQKKHIGLNYLTKKIFDKSKKQLREVTWIYRRNYKLLPNIQDPLSLLFYFRSFNYQINRDYFFPVYANGKNWKVKANINRSEKKRYVKAYKKYLNVLEVTPHMNFPGILPEKAKMKVYFTDDDYKIPVYAEVKMGILKNAYCYLVKHEKNGKIINYYKD